jgi:hypothetical protein
LGFRTWPPIFYIFGSEISPTEIPWEFAPTKKKGTSTGPLAQKTKKTVLIRGKLVMFGLQVPT